MDDYWFEQRYSAMFYATYGNKPAWRDKQNDVWYEGDDGLMHSHETAPFPREHVEKKWGPLVAVT